MFKKEKKNGKVFLIFIVAILSLAGGIVGDIIFRSYFYDSIYGFSSLGEINYSDSSYRNTNLIIRDAKKVVVEQNQKTREIISNVSGNLVAIIKNKPTSTPSGQEDVNLVSDLAGQGSIVTSDGWILTPFKGFKDARDLMDNYKVITNDKKFYKIDKVLNDKKTKSNFIHISAKGLPVRSFSEQNSLRVGDSIIAIDFNGSALATPLISLSEKSKATINMDNDIKKYYTADNLSVNFKGAFLFDFSGNLAGMVNEGQPENIISYIQAINSLLKTGTLKRASVGITYVNVEYLANYPNKKGEMIISVAKGSLAESAGLKAGHLITSVNGLELNKDTDLYDILSGYSVGSIISITYLTKENISKESKITLKEQKN